MIKRLVKLTLKPKMVNTFIDEFVSKSDLIKSSNVCTHLEIWRDVNNKNIVFTYSIWDSEKKLNEYRQSELFEDVWSKVKPLFNKRMTQI